MPETIPQQYKVLRPDGTSVPTGGSPGFLYPYNRWTPPVANPRCCARGYHTVSAEHIIRHAFDGCIVVECAGRGARHESSDKIAWESVKRGRRVGTLDARTLRLFACDCAEHTLHLFESRHPGDDRPRKAIETARLYVAGNASHNALVTSRRAAADVADAAAYAAYADAAAYAAYAAAAYAAYAAAAYAAAYAATYAAAYAERKWQTERLFSYLRDEA